MKYVHIRVSISDTKYSRNYCLVPVGAVAAAAGEAVSTTVCMKG
jgi:hypothetical protein